VTYLSHVTGHGLLKLMRPVKPLTYRIERLPEVPEVLRFLVARPSWTLTPPTRPSTWDRAMRVYCAKGDAEAVLEIAQGLGLSALLAGQVEEGPRQVILEPVDVRFAGDELELSSAGADPPP